MGDFSLIDGATESNYKLFLCGFSLYVLLLSWCGVRRTNGTKLHRAVM